MDSREAGARYWAREKLYLGKQREVIQEKEEQVDAIGARIQRLLDALNQIISPFCLKLASGFPLYLE